tara:strand:- start:1140 stop:1856 length:717 start_codon:yes stop_codon:yes gene_type:complete
MIVLITGASRGIGKAIAQALAKSSDVDGLILTSRDATSMCTEFAENKKVYPMSLNYSDSSSIEAFLKQLDQMDIWPDVLINNAGATRDALAIRLKLNDWQESLDTNLNGPFQLTQSCFRHMLKRKFGRIINLSSVVAHTGNVGQVNYIASKAALEGMTKALALEGARRNVTVNSIAPGFIETDMTDKLSDTDKEKLIQRVPMGRMGHADDIAKVVEFIMSSSYVTGQTFHVNGGMYLA